MADGEPRFSRATFDYLRELEQHNDKEWFEANRSRYESRVREPALAFIRAMAPRLAEARVPLLADDRKVGGSLMRVHKDVRFSKDKAPYKTNIGIHFRHIAGKDVHAPGLYVHIASDECFVGLGMWHPDARALAAIRARIDARSTAYRKVLEEVTAAKWRRGGDSLKRPPRGFTAEHPMVEELMRKDHILIRDLSKESITGGGLGEVVEDHLLTARGYLKFLCEAIDV